MMANRHPCFWLFGFTMILFGSSGFAQKLRVDDDHQSCMATVAAMTNPEIVSFHVKHDRGPVKFKRKQHFPSGLGWDDGILDVVGGCMFFHEAGQTAPVSVGSCDSTPWWVKPTQDGTALWWYGYLLMPDEEKLTVSGLHQGILAACDTQKAKKMAELEVLTARLRAESTSSFGDSIHAVLRAAEETDPFVSIRGDYDLSTSDSHQWKTSLKLVDAQKCSLFKTPAQPPSANSAWTFVCMFNGHRDTAVGSGIDFSYEGMVKSVQSLLNLPYQPDEKAAGINQVFFSDPSKPAWRLFVARINEITTGLSVVAVRSEGTVPTVPSTALYSGVPTMLPTETTVRDEIEKIRAGRYAPMPPAQPSTDSSSSGSGRTTVTVKNSTSYELFVFYDGPFSTKVTVSPGMSQDLDLAPGTFRVAGRVAAVNVLPFYAEETYTSSKSYSVTFYIGQH